ncbi:MAG: hypothetical protein JOZ62_07160 [Acidobacteriaceae bacterium]|nr:hypothetical protein [Acidobacteriaceae bacterium]
MVYSVDYPRGSSLRLGFAPAYALAAIVGSATALLLGNAALICEVEPFPVVSDTVPTFVRSGQDFRTYKIYDPMTTRLCVQGPDNCQGSTDIRDPFPGNVIPASRISPIAVNILKYYPQPEVATAKL